LRPLTRARSCRARRVAMVPQFFSAISLLSIAKQRRRMSSQPQYGKPNPREVVRPGTRSELAPPASIPAVFSR
jgi:SMC interacting uncharacterized protein involved in chromosome segregation